MPYCRAINTWWMPKFSVHYYSKGAVVTRNLREGRIKELEKRERSQNPPQRMQKVSTSRKKRGRRKREREEEKEVAPGAVFGHTTCHHCDVIMA